MKHIDDISSHIQNISEMAMILADLGHTVPDKMIITKIIYSLPPSYNSIIAAYTNVSEENQTVDNLEERLIRHESLLLRQGGTDTDIDQAFFTRSASSSQSRLSSKKEQYQKDLSYIRDLKARTKCYNCHEFGHWSADCPKPKKKRTNGKDPRKIDGGLSEANLVESLRITSSSDEDSKSVSNEDFAFVITSTLSSYALTIESSMDAWFADSGASEHMTDRLEWFSNFRSIHDGVHTVQIANDTKLWVRGKGDIQIRCLIDGEYHRGLMRDVLYVLKLKWNLFSVGLVLERNLSFITFLGRCEFTTLSGKKVLEGTRFRKLYQLSITVVPPKQVVTCEVLDSAHVFTNSSNDAYFSTDLLISDLPAVDSALVASSSNTHDDLILWHERMVHVNIPLIHQMSAMDSLHDFKLKKPVHLKHPCEGCMLGKQQKSSYKHDPNKQRSTIPGQLIHGDVSGKQNKNPSLKGSMYYILYKDHATAYRFVHSAEQKSEAFPFFKRVVKLVKKETGHDVLAIRTDQGKEIINDGFNKYLNDMNINHQTSTVYTPQQNGYIERDNRIVMEMARSLVLAKDLLKKLWAEAVSTAVYLLNRTINHQLGHITPYEKWFKEKPSVQHFKVFGSLSWVFVNKALRTKLDPKSVKMYFVGYSSTSRAYRFWEPVTDKIIESADYTIDEKSGKYRPNFPPDLGIEPYTTISIDPFTPEIDHVIPFQHPIEVISNTSNEGMGDLNSSGSCSQITPDTDLPNCMIDDSNQTLPAVGVSLDPIVVHSSVVELDDANDEPLDSKFRSIQELLNCTPRLPDYPNLPELPEEPEPPNLFRIDPMYPNAIRISNALIALVGEAIQDPQTYREAISSVDSTSWQEAMDREYASLIENQTWDLVQKPPHCKPVQNK